MIAHSLGYRFVPEEEIGVHEAYRLHLLLSVERRIVVQCPALLAELPSIVEGDPDILVVLMRRDVADIIASQERIGWQHEAEELERLGVSEGPIAQRKYEWWEANKHRFQHVYELDYESLREHPLWIAQRRNFGARQTEMKVLLFCPLHPRKLIYPETKAAIEALDTTGFDVTIHYEGEEHKGRSQDAYDQITAKYQHGRKLLLSGDYDAMLTVEYDNIVPPDALQKLAKVDADIAYGLYCTRHNSRWLAFLQIWDTSGIAYSRDEPTAKAAWGKVVETQGVGLGCTLIHRHVLEALPFRRKKGHPCCNDWWLALDAIEKGFVQKHDCSVLVGHIVEPNCIIWPIPEEPFYRTVERAMEKKQQKSDEDLCEYICNSVIYSRSQDHYYQVGDSIWLTPDRAEVHLRKRQITPVEQTVDQEQGE